MIVISTYNPDTKRTTQDEELLTTMLVSFIRELVYSTRIANDAKNEISKEHAARQKENCNRLIGQVAPLLGLGWPEVYELIKQEEHSWQIDPTGKK